MKNLTIFVALGWFWLTFYSVGPLTSWAQVALGGLALAAGCLGAVLWGIRRRQGRGFRRGTTEP